MRARDWSALTFCQRNDTLQYVVAREQSVIQTKVVLLLALLALARNFIVLLRGDRGGRGVSEGGMTARSMPARSEVMALAR